MKLHFILELINGNAKNDQLLSISDSVLRFQWKLKSWSEGLDIGDARNEAIIRLVLQLKISMLHNKTENDVILQKMRPRYSQTFFLQMCFFT